MNFVFGRSNLALTIFVPYDCRNNCSFCTSKKNYAKNRPSYRDVRMTLKNLFRDYSFPIKDVVFTGGEPMADVIELRYLIDLVPPEYNIYINTTYTNRGLPQFVKLVNECDKIKGVNISRHSESFEEDCFGFHDIADDAKIRLIKKPVRINCVIGDQSIEKVVDRWKTMPVELCFREDFTTMQNDPKHLHDPFGAIPMKLLQLGYEFLSHTQCNVCDTTRFIKDKHVVSFHKGRQYSSILSGDTLEINDLIITQNGHFRYDWGVEDKLVEQSLLMKFYKYRSFLESVYTQANSYSGGCGYSSGCGYTSGCGGSNCGGSSYSSGC